MATKISPDNRAQLVLAALKQEGVAVDTVLGGFTQAQIAEKLQDVATAMDSFNAADAAMVEARNKRDAALNTLNDVNIRVVDGIKATYGQDSSVYEASGYTRKGERATGLTRKGVTPAAAKGGKGSAAPAV